MQKIVNIDKSDYINAINLHLGIYRPLSGFVTQDEYENILFKKKLYTQNFTIPINLFCKKQNFDNFHLNETIYLRYKNTIIGNLVLKSKFKIKNNLFLKSIFGNKSKNHLGVYNFLNKLKRKPYSLGGEVFIYESKTKKFFKKSNFETLKMLMKLNKKDIVFSTRNIPHIGHNLIHRKLIDKKLELCIFLIIGVKNKYDHNTLIKSYLALKKNEKFKKIKIFSIYLPTFFAGPNEAFFQAKIFENLGFKYFYVGRDHAGYKSFYEKFESQNIFKVLKSKIKIIKFNEPMLCKLCKIPVINKYKEKKKCPKCQNDQLIELNGKDIKHLIQKKQKNILFNFLDPAVQKFIKKIVYKKKKLV